MIFDFEIDEKVCFSKASYPVDPICEKIKKWFFTGKGMMKV